MRMLFLLWLGLCLHGGSLLAQLKMEREYRVSAKQVPQAARQLVDSCFAGTKVKWYAEEGIGHKSFEAKLKQDKKHFSIEFDTLGNVEDVELDIKLEAVPDKVRGAIEKHLGETFRKHKIAKVQVQWRGERSQLHAKIKGRQPATVETFYEIVVVGLQHNLYKSFELLFDENGEVVDFLEIIHNSNENLVY